MINLARTAYREYSGTWRVLESGRGRFVLRAIQTFHKCVQSKNLRPLDLWMPGEFNVRYRGESLIFPVEEMDRWLDGHDNPHTFGAMREMIVRDLYLRAFRPGLRAATVVDLGSNRGMFLLLAAKSLGATLSVGVEPEKAFDGAFEILRNRNQIDPKSAHRVTAMIMAEQASGAITMDDLFTTYGITSVDFLKCDIEGAEYDLFARNNGWVSKCQNIAMEVHSEHGSTAAIVDMLRGIGFTCFVSDDHGAEVGCETATYVYASQSDDLDP